MRGAAPASIEQMYSAWSGRLAKTVRSYGFPEDEVPDIVQELLVRFCEGKGGKNYLAFYEPSKGAFSTYMYTFMLKRLLGWRARRNIRISRELPLVTGYQTGDGDWLPFELLDTSAWRDFADVESALNISLVIRQLQRLGKEGRSSAILLRDMAAQIEEGGRIDRPALAAKHHISQAELRRRIKRMRELQPIMAWHDG